MSVQDGGPNPSVPAGQRAFTIAAVNNGPDTAPAAQVTLAGVPAGATVGSISHGSYDAANGVWTIGELETAEYRRARNQHEGVTLTLLTSAAAGREITATIANTKDYQVCIDSSGNDVAASSRSPITGYTLQAANGRNGRWANATPQLGVNDLAYDYGGLSPRARKYFRIWAANEFGGGL